MNKIFMIDKRKNMHTQIKILVKIKNSEDKRLIYANFKQVVMKRSTFLSNNHSFKTYVLFLMKVSNW